MYISIQIPKAEKLLIKKGQNVDFKTPFVVKKKSSTVKIPIASLMSSKPSNIYKLVKKTVGQHVTKGEVIAEDKNLFSSKKYICQLSGVLTAIDENEGAVILETKSENSGEILCHFFGEISQIHDTHIEVKVKNTHKAKIKETSSEFGAPIFYNYAPNSLLNEDDIEGKFLVSEDINPIDQAKIKTLGEIGIIGLNNPVKINLHQISLVEKKDWDHVVTKKFPFVITDVDKNTIIFYE